MNPPDELITGPTGQAVAALEAAWSALARIDLDDRVTLRKACERIAAGELAVSQATYCPDCDAEVGGDCAAYCPGAPRAAEEILAEYLAVHCPDGLTFGLG